MLIQLLSVLLAGIALLEYLRRRRRLRTDGLSWPGRRAGWFTLGLLLVLAVSCGPVAHYDRLRYWVWVSQALVLLLVAPVPLMAGRPIELVRAAGRRQAETRAKPIAADRSRGSRLLGSPLLGPAVVPLVCVAVLFGPVPGWAAGNAGLSWLIQLLLVLLGSVIVLPLVRADDQISSVAVGVAVAVGFVELLIDAIPGIVLRLSTHPVSSFFTHRRLPTGEPSWLHDQQIGGGILWCVAELLDLPFLLLIFRQWIRADSREAAAIDAVLDAEASTEARGGDTTGTPWFLSDPRLRDRLR
ncbi:MAG TPA: cytochrome c oxidase assembly protein [Jatrophihabitans sp.]|nr:cytochrome c oxidase assembly protein [Jatrophihabitans sp.]